MQVQDLQYRYEIKQLITPVQYYLLTTLLQTVMEKDVNASCNGSYFIRSIYFDDIFDSALYQKRSGVGNRNKYRIRFYNLSDKLIHLECKRKIGTRIAKTSLPVSKECAEKMVWGNFALLERINHPLAKEVCALSKAKLLRAKIMVDYTREAYCSPLSNTRLTFDKELTAAEITPDLFSTQNRSVGVFNDNIIFEIKYDNFLPDYIQNILSHVKGERAALSKYMVCRDEQAIFMGN